MDSKKTGLLIAILRKEKGFTQRELAEKLNVTDKAISKWETGEGYPEITMIPALAEILGVTIDEFFKGERNSSVNNLAGNGQEEPNTAQREYLLNRSMLKFKNLFMLTIGLTIFSVIAFFTITLTTYYEVLGFGVQMTLLLISCIVFSMGYYSYDNSINEYTKMSQGQIDDYRLFPKRAVVTSIWVWIMSVILTMPYVVLDEGFSGKSIITFDTYLTSLPLFLMAGGLFAAFLIKQISLFHMYLSYLRKL